MLIYVKEVFIIFCNNTIRNLKRLKEGSSIHSLLSFNVQSISVLIIKK